MGLHIFIVVLLLCTLQSLIFAFPAKLPDTPSSSNILMISGIVGSLLGGLYFLTDEPVFDTANDIPTIHYQDKKEIEAVVIKITDGDTYRVRHVNSRHRNPEFAGKLSDHTIAVRICAVDTPEISHMGKPAQEFSKEAVDFATDKILGKKVKLKLQAKDRYGRALAFVEYTDSRGLKIFNSKNDMSEELLKRGLAVVYRQGGAQYGGSIDKWNYMEDAAIRNKRGLWVNGKSKAELPSEYKKKHSSSDHKASPKAVRRQKEESLTPT
jgi:micrococcal nuclease